MESITKQLRAWLEIALLIAVVCSALIALWAFGRARVGARIYAKRLETVAADYERLRKEYNRAISRTAVTELRVRGTNVMVAVRTADGVTREFPTSCRPDKEVYVDYVVLDGRLWIRRVFDSTTPPQAGTVIDPSLAGINWDTNTTAVGKAVYRRLDEGRWIVTVSGDGSLGLQRVSENADIVLSPPPPVLDFETIKREVETEQTKISWLDLLRALIWPEAAGQ